MAMILAAVPMSAQNAVQVLDKAIAKLSSAPGVTCSFTASGDGGNVKGTLKTGGEKFHLSTPASKTWYDGRTMWTANAQTKEITIVNPTAEEISQVNPFAYLRGVRGNYRMAFSKRKEAGKHLVVLNPVRKGEGIKAVEVALDKTTLLPVRFIIRDDNDRRTTINVSGLNLKGGNAPSDFICPSKNLKGYEVVDLR